ncbi:PREDICTED: uncharacterized protein LOC108561183 isoform X4 [Nicrophorus vespilloides]|uniref:Uncharacterized protein LOC108561183 isoform X4 n=3 Tax=Nicrophorus vespilloides TaxID=110193 RepID=A0ABM1MIU2_NICVS|nr:PREDICTED: uncharacterized protein LOC108561183 isoform X4 [Nicrophorus vespilloides]
MDLEMQLRAAEVRRSDLQRAHAEALTGLRDCGSDQLDARQSRVRELEKKVALETVRCEELQLELATSQRNCRLGGIGIGGGGGVGSGGGGGSVVGGIMCSSTAVHQYGGPSPSGKGTEIDRIMAKIEQDNRILAELDHTRSTTTMGGGGLATSASSHALGESSPPISPITMSHTTPSLYPGIQSSGNNSMLGGHQGYQSCSQPNNNSLSSYLPISNNPVYNSSSSAAASNLYSYAPKTILGGSGALTSSLGVGGGSCSAAALNISGLGGGGGNSYNSNSTFTNPLMTTLPSLNSSYTNPVTSTLNQYNLPPPPSSYNSLPTTGSYANNVTFSNPLSSQFNSLTGNMSIKLKPLEEMELDVTGNRRVATPCTPHQTCWGIGVTGLGLIGDGTTSSSTAAAAAAVARSRLLNDGLDSDWSGMSGLHMERTYLNGHQQPMTSSLPPLNAAPEGTVDMLDIPGKGRCSVYIARFSYDPEDSDEELAVQAGDYLLVWGEPIGSSGYLDAELLDGRRGLVPSHFAQRLIVSSNMSHPGDDLLEFHQAVLSTLREDEINAETFAADVQRLTELAEMSEGQEDDLDNGETDYFFSVLVPAPKQLTLERQLNKSVLISWTSPDIGPGNQIESYHVYVDGVLKTTIKATERTRALVEGVDSNRPHRISVRSVTANRRTSRDAACTMIIGRDTHQLGPSAVRASNITSTQAVISWLPANSNHQHVVCVNNVEVRCVKPGIYRHTITGLAPNTQYRVTVRAKHHRAAQNVANVAEDLPLPAAAHTDFRTLPKGLPDPPSEIQLEPGPQDGTLLVTWHPVLTPHAHAGSTITGYAVFADGKKVTDVDSPTGDHALIDIGKLLGLNPKHVTVRTKARDGQSADSLPTLIPMTVLRGGANRNSRQQPHSAMPMHMRQQMTNRQQQQQHLQQQVIEHDENLSDKEIFPSAPHRQQHPQQQSGIPSIVIAGQVRMGQRGTHQQQQQMRGGMSQQQQQPPTAQKRARWFVALFEYDPSTMSPNPDACDEELPFSEGDSIKVWGDKDADGFYWGECHNRRGYVPHNMVMEVEGGQNRDRDRWADIYASMPMKRMVALYDYDPQELSPNVDAEQVELSFTTGQIINVYGEMDDDGFYMGEIEGVRGLVPSNFLTEAPDQYGGGAGGAAAVGAGVSGLQQQQQQQQMGIGRGGGQQGAYNAMQRGGRGHGPGARGPPPPPRDNSGRSTRTKPDACPVLPSQSDTTNTAPPNTQGFTEHQRRGPMSGQRGGNFVSNQQQQQQLMQQQQTQQPQQQQQNPSSGGFFSNATVSSLFGGGTTTTQPANNQQNSTFANQSGQFGNATNQQQQMQQQQQQQQQQQPGSGGYNSRLQQKGIPQVIPNVSQPMNVQMGNQQQSQQQQNATAGPNLMQKLNEMTAPGGDILSKGKELIFMKFGLGGK